MLTPFGREVRKLRIDSNPPLKLKDLADKIGVSSAYLSAVETGAKPASAGIVFKLADALKVETKKKLELERLASESVRVVQLDLSQKNTSMRNLATAFARRFDSLDEDDVAQLLKIIQRDERKVKVRLKK